MVLCSLQIIHKKTNVLQARCLVNYFAIKERLGKKKRQIERTGNRISTAKQVAKILQPP
jgi:hypothetical protein